MNIVKLSETVAVAAQISPEQVAEIAAAGYKVLVNNRPDNEEGGQPAEQLIAAAAAAAGMEYHHLPVTGFDFPGDGFDQMCDLFDDAEAPVLAFCRTGTRCTNLWVASHDQATMQQAADVAQRLGFDLGMAAAYLERQSRSAT